MSDDTPKPVRLNLGDALRLVRQQIAAKKRAERLRRQYRERKDGNNRRGC